MTPIRCDVNDATLRASFLRDTMRQTTAVLTENTQPRWGDMTPQQMIEHLVWTFRCSTGILDSPCYTPLSILERTRRFLYDNRHTPRELRNPALGETLPSLQFATLAEAREGWQREGDHYIEYSRTHRNAQHVHPIFGPIGLEQWQRAHVKRRTYSCDRLKYAHTLYGANGT